MSLTFLPGQIPTESESVMLQNLPAAGQLFYFFNTDKNGDVYSIDSNGNIVFVASVNDNCCSCCLSQSWLDGLNQALLNSAMTASQYQQSISSGFNVQSSNQGGGNCSILITPNQPILIGISIFPAGDEHTIAPSDTLQLGINTNPVGANNNVVWVSSDPSFATISSSGLITGVSAGTTTITAYSVVSGTITAHTTIVVS